MLAVDADPADPIVLADLPPATMLRSSSSSAVFGIRRQHEMKLLLSIGHNAHIRALRDLDAVLRQHAIRIGIARARETKRPSGIFS